MNAGHRAAGRRLLAYMVMVDLLALVAILSLPRGDVQRAPWTLLLMIVLTAVVGFRPIHIRAIHTTISASDPFVFAAIAALGGLPAVLIGLVGITSSMIGAESRFGARKAIFNLASSALAIAAGSWVYEALATEPSAPLQKLLPLIGATTGYLLVNTLVVSMAISMANRKPLLETWSRTGLWTAVTSYCGTTIAIGLLYLLELGGPELLILGVPPVWLFIAYFRSHRDRLHEQQKRMEQVLENNQRLEEQVRARTAQLAAKVAELEQAREHLRELANTDELTMLPNRRRLQLHLAQELSRSKRFKHPFSVLLIDIDHFKRVNDTYGHPMGDFVLANLAALIGKCVRNADLAARYGGEEFAVVLAETEKCGALTLAGHLIKRVGAASFKCDDIDPGRITVSVGVASFPEDAETVDGLIAAADERLYQAKEAGRDRVVA